MNERIMKDGYKKLKRLKINSLIRKKKIVN